MSGKKIKEILAKHYRYFIVGGLFLVLVVVLIIILVTRKDDDKTSNAGSAAGSAGTEVVQTSLEVPNDKYEVDKYPNVNTLVASYLDAMSIGDSDTMAALSNSLSNERRAFFEEQAKYIGNYSNYKVYTKKGPQENSYVALVTYDLQILGDPTTLPGLLSLYVCTNDAGALYINNSDLTDDEEAYILELVSQNDFVELQDSVQLAYNEIIEENTLIAEKAATLKTEINAGVQVKLEEQKQAETEAAAAQAQEEAEAAKQAAATTVKATDNVNIRASASTEADILGKATAGETYTRYELMDNGWSKIDYNGKEAYIKSEYLEDVPGEGAVEQAGDDSSDSGSSSSRKAGDMITIKENVNIRDAASESGNKLGVAYMGEQYTLVEESGGWCKIKYDGKDAYIKSDFVK